MKQKTNKQTNKEEKSKRAQKLYTEENIENVSRQSSTFEMKQKNKQNNTWKENLKRTSQ